MVLHLKDREQYPARVVPTKIDAGHMRDCRLVGPEKMPPELIIRILISAKSIPDLVTLAISSPVFFRCYRVHWEYILERVVKDGIPGDLFTLLYRAAYLMLVKKNADRTGTGATKTRPGNAMSARGWTAAWEASKCLTTTTAASSSRKH